MNENGVKWVELIWTLVRISREIYKYLNENLKIISNIIEKKKEYKME